jgi:hypothetical protein
MQFYAVASYTVFNLRPLSVSRRLFLDVKKLEQNKYRIYVPQ